MLVSNDSSQSLLPDASPVSPIQPLRYLQPREFDLSVALWLAST